MKKPIDKEKEDQFRMLVLMMEIERSGSGKFAKYDLANELVLIDKKESALSTSQRKKVLKIYEIIKKSNQ